MDRVGTLVHAPACPMVSDNMMVLFRALGNLEMLGMCL